MIKFIIPGDPKGKARPRVTKFGAYTPIETKNYETYVKLLAKQASSLFFDSEALFINIKALLLYP